MTPSTDSDERREMSAALKRIRELEMENEVLCRAAAYLSKAHITPPKMIYPLVRELATTGARVRVPIAVTCRVLGFSEQAYYQWLKAPRSAREVEEEDLIGALRQLHEDDPEGGYRVLADDLHDPGYKISERRVWWLCHLAGIQSVIVTRKRRYPQAQQADTGRVRDHNEKRRHPGDINPRTQSNLQQTLHNRSALLNQQEDHRKPVTETWLNPCSGPRNPRNTGVKSVRLR